MWWIDRIDNWLIEWNKMDFVEKSIQFFIIIIVIILIYSYFTFKCLFNFRIYVTSLRKQYIYYNIDVNHSLKVHENHSIIVEAKKFNVKWFLYIIYSIIFQANCVSFLNSNSNFVTISSNDSNKIKRRRKPFFTPPK